MKNILTLLILLSVLILISCSKGGSTSELLQATPEKGNFKDKIQIDNVVANFTVLIRPRLVSGEQSISKPAEGGIYMIVYCSATNAGATPQLPFDIDLKLVDPNNVEYAADVAATAALYSISDDITAKIVSNINPGISVTTASVFEISDAMLDQQFWKIKYSLFGKTYLLDIMDKNAPQNKQAEMVLVAGGTFNMGSKDFGPIHKVTLDSFYIGKYEVSMRELRALHNLEKALTPYKGDLTLPASEISWTEAIQFCNQKSEAEGLTPCYSNDADGNIQCDFSVNGYRLPTEAEWEFAARGGNESKGYTYSGSDKIVDVANCHYGLFSNDADMNLTTISAGGTKAANELGIYDMTGNVFEWVWDKHADYTAAELTNPTGSSTGYPIYRGGFYRSSYGICSRSVAFRSDDTPYIGNDCYGFRLARTY